MFGELDPKIIEQIEEILRDKPLTTEFDHTDPSERKFALCSDLIKQCMDSLSLNPEFMDLLKNSHPDVGIKDFEIGTESGIYLISYKNRPIKGEQLGTEYFVITKNFEERLVLNKVRWADGKVSADIRYSEAPPNFSTLKFPQDDNRTALEAKRVVDEFTRTV